MNTVIFRAGARSEGIKLCQIMHIIRSVGMTKETVDDQMRAKAQDTVIWRLVKPNQTECIASTSTDTFRVVKPYERILFIGDIHGCMEELTTHLRNNNYNLETDLLISVGDLIMKGPEGRKVLEFFMEDQERRFSVKGNHEYAIQRWYEVAVLENGIRDVADLPSINHLLPIELRAGSKHAHFAISLTQREYEYLRDLPHMIQIENYVVIHAGINPFVGTGSGDVYRSQNSHDLMHIRNISDGRGMQKAREGIPWYECLTDPASAWRMDERCIVYGHDSARNLNIWGDHYAGIDSGCVYGGHLTSLTVDSTGKYIYSTPNPTAYCPPEK